MLDKEKIYVVILAGGQGTRFWPVSRKARPKQFLALAGGEKSLIQESVSRALLLVNDPKKIMIVTSISQEKLTREHCPDVEIVCEPSPKNTAASIGLAAKKIHSCDSQAVLLVLPSDHYIKNSQLLLASWREAIEHANREEQLVTIGIKPSQANTGYGYIKKGEKISENIYQVSRFFEKPNLERAKSYFESEQYLWNSGMFVWRTSVILQALHEHMPKLSCALEKIASKNFGKQVLDDEFKSLESISIDFGVLELAKNCSVIAGQDFGWSDLGSWDSCFLDLASKRYKAHAEDNLLNGEALVIDGKDCVVHSDRRMVVLLGLSDVITIDTEDAILICSRDKAQDVKKVVDQLKKIGREDLI
jgi:mannose-1-phosphate guanylyltransferase